MAHRLSPLFEWTQRPRGLRPHAWLITRMLRNWLLRPLARLKIFQVNVTGKQHLPKRGGNIIAGNHPAPLDGVVVAGALDRNVMFFAKAELWRNWLLAPLLKALDYIPVDRGNRESGTEAQTLALAILTYGRKRGEDKGGTVAIFPEGKLSPQEGTFGPLKSGLYYLAQESGVPVIPVALKGTGRILKARPWHVLRTGCRVQVYVHFGEPMYAKDFADRQSFMAAWAARVDDLYRQFG